MTSRPETSGQLAVLAQLQSLLDAQGVAYWLFGGWAVDFHTGRLTRAHDDLDVAVWHEDRARVAELLADDGWSHTPEAGEDGYTCYARGAVRLEVAFLARDDSGRVYTPLRDGRGEWPSDTFGDDVIDLLGVKARVIRLDALIADKSIERDDATTSAKDRADLANLRDRSLTVWTIGHSTRSSDELRSVLTGHDIELVADVRRFPGSRRLPQFAVDALARELGESGILYHWIAALGGRRRPAATTSVNEGWRHPAFRAYADHVATEEFAHGLEELFMLANGLRTVIMCAELLWWRCHRRIIADVLTSLGVRVIHLRDDGPGELHHLAAPARVVRGRLTYAPSRADVAR
jgi:hypothetical protein